MGSQLFMDASDRVTAYCVVQTVQLRFIRCVRFKEDPYSNS